VSTDLATVLNRAADHMQNTGPDDVIEAIYVAIHSQPHGALLGSDDQQLLDAAVTAVGEQIGWGSIYVGDWSDRSTTTQAVATLRATADRISAT
jgi:hypothetical protein